MWKGFVQVNKDGSTDNFDDMSNTSWFSFSSYKTMHVIGHKDRCTIILSYSSLQFPCHAQFGQKKCGIIFHLFSVILTLRRPTQFMKIKLHSFSTPVCMDVSHCHHKLFQNQMWFPLPHSFLLIIYEADRILYDFLELH